MINKELNDLIKSKYDVDILNDYLAYSYGNVVFCFDWSKRGKAEISFLRGGNLAKKDFGEKKLVVQDFLDMIVIDNPIADIYGPENYLKNIERDLTTLDVKYDLYLPTQMNEKVYWNSIFLKSLTKKDGKNELIYGHMNYSSTRVPRAVLYYQNTFRDIDTKLYTKESLKLHIKQAKETDHSYGLYFDIDNFKRINDVFGHKNGDAFLQELADAMRKDKMKSPNCQYYRIGGDEFFVLIRNCTEKEAYKKAQDVIYIIETLNAHGQQVDVSASVGIVPIIGNDINFTEMLERADKTMYYSKGRGKGFISHAREV